MGEKGASKEPCVLGYFKHNQMYAGIRVGEALVYGPRYRCIHGFGAKFGQPVYVSAVRPSSQAQAWEVQGYEWNACAIDAAVHLAFGAPTMYTEEEKLTV